MKVEKIRDFSEIVEESRNFDKVLVPDVETANVLEAERGEPGRAKFATPESVAGLEPGWPREMFLRLKEGRSWRQASYLKDAAESCLRTTGGLEAMENLDIDEETRREVEEVLDQILGLPLEPVETGRTAVIGLDQMTGLQKALLPEHERIDIYEGSTGLEEFRIFPTPGEIASTVEAVVKDCDSEEIGVVVSESSVYRSAIESRFEAAGIPYHSRESPSQSQDLRTFVALLRAGTSSGSLSLQSVKPVLDQLGISYPESKARSKIESVDSLEGFQELLSVLPSLSYRDALERYEELAGETGIGSVLEELGLIEQGVSEESLSRLTYYLESVESGQVDERGVKIRDPASSGLVDRSMVLFLGMADDWNPDVEDWPWTSREEELGRSVARMKACLQSGERQIYMVQDVEMNREVQPCVQLQEISGKALESFSDAQSSRYRAKMKESSGGFEHHEVEVSEGNLVDPLTLSQSQLNDLALSPKQYYFSRLVSDADDLSMEKGNLFHDFAEFYLSHPNFVEEEGLEEFVEFVMDELDQYMDDLERRSLRTEIETGLRNLVSFLEPEGSQELPFDTVESRYENEFAKEYDREIRTGNTEVGFSDEELGANGKIDLIQGNVVVDFKSGRSRSPFKAFRKSHPDLYSNERFPDFQPLLYTAFVRKHVDGRLKFRYFHFLDSLGESVLGERDEEDDVVELVYVPEKFEKYMQTNEFFRKVIGDVAESNDRRKTLEKIGRSRFAEFVSEHGFPEVYSKEEIEETEFFEKLQEFGRETVGDYKYVSKGLESAAKKAVEIRTSNFYLDDVEKFEEFLKDQRESLKEYLETGFPVGDRKIEDLPSRDMIIG